MGYLPTSGLPMVAFDTMDIVPTNVSASTSNPISYYIATR